MYPSLAKYRTKRGKFVGTGLLQFCWLGSLAIPFAR